MAAGAAALALLFAAGGNAAAQDNTAAAQSPAESYCLQKGGKVEVRRPVYGSNGSNLLFLTGSRQFCQFRSKKDGSRIHILLETLYSTQPSLAALAYYNPPPYGGGGGGNPASYYCTQLGGTDVFGGPNDPAGGGWYLKGTIDETLEACIFPDMSSIDSWGLTYKSAGIIRGIDLTTVMRFNPNK